MTDPAHVLAVARLDFSYSGVQVLFGATLDVRAGEILALTGPNGGGKTTLLRCIAGLEQVDAGRVVLGDDDITRVAAEHRVSRGLVTVFGGQAVFPDLTVDGNLITGGQLLRGTGLLAERIAEVFSIFPRLEQRRRALAAQLSGGEQQMLSLGKAFVLRPRVLCIDELSLGLAPTLVARLLDVLRRFRDAGVSILLVEQSARVAAEIADRAAFMEKGEVGPIGDPAEVLDIEALRIRYLERRLAAAGQGQ